MTRKISRDLKWTIVVLLSLTGLVACESAGQQCYEPIVIRVTNNFQWIDTFLTDSAINGTNIKWIKRRYYDSIMPSGEMKILNEDTVFYLVGTEPGNNVMRIALDPHRDSVRYTFRADTLATNTRFDTITYYYAPVTHFISNNCGYTYYYTLSGAKTTHNMLDSVALTNASVTNDVNARNLYLYFKPPYK